VTYTDSADVKASICRRISEGESLRQIIQDDGMPASSTVFKWLSEDQAFSEQYARARELQADAIFDDILAIADDGHNDWMKRNHGEDESWVENGEAMRRSQLRIDARKWMAGKLQPKKYGDKVTTDLNLRADESISGLLTRIAASGSRLMPEDEPNT
jgi:hypothetical protein